MRRRIRLRPLYYYTHFDSRQSVHFHFSIRMHRTQFVDRENRFAAHWSVCVCAKLVGSALWRIHAEHKTPNWWCCIGCEQLQVDYYLYYNFISRRSECNSKKNYDLICKQKFLVFRNFECFSASRNCLPTWMHFHPRWTARHPSAREMKFTQPEIKAKMKSDEKLNINWFWLFCCCSLLALARSRKLENWSRWRMTEPIYFDLFRMTCITSKHGHWHVLEGVKRRSWAIFWQLHSFRCAISVDPNDKLHLRMFDIQRTRFSKNGLNQRRHLCYRFHSL